MARQAMWVHGNSATIRMNNRGRTEYENVDGIDWTSLEGLRRGWGVVYRCQDNSEYWFHFAIPSPVWRDEVRARLRRVMVLFTADTGVTLSSIFVWDGPNQVFRRDGLAIGGRNRTLIDGKNAFNTPAREVEWGIGVSVKFYFADPGNVILHAAGVDFDV